MKDKFNLLICHIVFIFVFCFMTSCSSMQGYCEAAYQLSDEAFQVVKGGLYQPFKFDSVNFSPDPVGFTIGMSQLFEQYDTWAYANTGLDGAQLYCTLLEFQDNMVYHSTKVYETLAQNLSNTLSKSYQELFELGYRIYAFNYLNSNCYFLGRDSNSDHIIEHAEPDILIDISDDFITSIHEYHGYLEGENFLSDLSSYDIIFDGSTARNTFMNTFQIQQWEVLPLPNDPNPVVLYNCGYDSEQGGYKVGILYRIGFGVQGYPYWWDGTLPLEPHYWGVDSSNNWSNDYYFSGTESRVQINNNVYYYDRVDSYFLSNDRRFGTYLFSNIAGTQDFYGFYLLTKEPLGDRETAIKYLQDYYSGESTNEPVARQENSNYSPLLQKRLWESARLREIYNDMDGVTLGNIQLGDGSWAYGLNVTNPVIDFIEGIVNDPDDPVPDMVSELNRSNYPINDPDPDPDPDPVPDPEPVPGITGTPVPDVFPVPTFDPIVKSFGSMFDVVSIFEPIFLVFGAIGGLFAFWLVVPFVLLFMAIIRILK